ncbi:MAG: bifunctional anthranilate synthase component I family protein/class IV aminotransferase [Endomicrobium sp.]|jgi:para-aminobenzoate synthetase/4-amino-4-deoxychorismate lyase|nr:bifunctional anthranilate synthase component I family protein/class IV aminotransferase [Endomicrobium sp.]
MFIYNNKLLSKHVKTIQAFNSHEFINAFDEINKYKKNYLLFGYIRYEAKDIFCGKNISNNLPFLYFKVFKDIKNFSLGSNIKYELDISSSISFDDYIEDIKKIKTEIFNGNTYEVNYTFDFNVKFKGSAFGLYNYLLQKQNTLYTSFIKNQYDTLLSFSPELFFSIEGNHIITKPMKGTIKRGKNKKEDEKNIEFLRTDIKNRSENIMIVDLLRNDLGKIAKAGTVKVTNLFNVETHKTLHQMTSQIEADLKENIYLFDVLKALFPCGSVTGAPKISTMNIIDKLEEGKRNIYCGAIGFITSKKCIFSVPIRILQKSIYNKNFIYRVGSAIVWDSNIQDEWMEAKTKTKFLNDEFQIVETMRIENKKILFMDRHISRMSDSAKHYRFSFDKKSIKIKTDTDKIVRILLRKTGEITIEYRNFTESKTNKVRISPVVTNSNSEFLYHKTTYRPYYDTDYNKYYDELFFNQKGELAEGSRTNILLEINNKLYTPALKSGLLNGILRQKLLEEGKCIEKTLKKKDLCEAESIYCINSVRGIKKVDMAWF